MMRPQTPAERRAYWEDALRTIQFQAMIATLDNPVQLWYEHPGYLREKGRIEAELRKLDAPAESETRDGK